MAQKAWDLEATNRIIRALETTLHLSRVEKLKQHIHELREDLHQIKPQQTFLSLPLNNEIPVDYVQKELQQILDTHTLERSKYYIRRLINSLSEIKTTQINDLNLNCWKAYEDILTDSLWHIPKRDNTGVHSADYWGNFVPQIPNQLLRRYTKQGDWVLDPFLGSGTTLIECQRLGRNGLGIELQAKVIQEARKRIKRETAELPPTQIKLLRGDAIQTDYVSLLPKQGIKSVQFLMIHPPYWDIIRFSEDQRDLSNATSMEDFLAKIGKLIDLTYPVLDTNRYLALVISDKYVKGEWIPLGFYTMQEVLKRPYRLKATIVKNFEETKAKLRQKELWRYRALAGGFYIFKHEYIFLFQKK